MTSACFHRDGRDGRSETTRRPKRFAHRLHSEGNPQQPSRLSGISHAGEGFV